MVPMRCLLHAVFLKLAGAARYAPFLAASPQQDNSGSSGAGPSEQAGGAAEYRAVTLMQISGDPVEVSLPADATIGDLIQKLLALPQASKAFTPVLLDGEEAELLAENGSLKSETDHLTLVWKDTLAQQWEAAVRTWAQTHRAGTREEERDTLRALWDISESRPWDRETRQVVDPSMIYSGFFRGNRSAPRAIRSQKGAVHKYWLKYWVSRYL